MSRSTSSPSDETIIGLYFARDEQAIAETARCYGRACMKLSMDILKSHADAEECVNDTYVRAWNSIPPARPRSLCAYVLRIVRNLSISRLRERKAERRGYHVTISLEELDECIPANEGGVEGFDARLPELLDRFLDTLDETSCRLFMGRYWYNLTVKELAADWGMTPSAASRNLSATREKLRDYLEKGGYTV